MTSPASLPGPVPPAPRWHALDLQEVLSALSTSPAGLRSDEAARRLAEHGPNVLPRARREGPLTLLRRQIDSPLIFVLLGSAAIAVALGKVTDGLVVLGVVVLNAAIGFVQESRAGRALEALATMIPEIAKVLRDGEKRSVSAAELVPGDVVLLDAGDKVPADMRLLEARSLRAEEASLTGESVPVAKQLAPVAGDAGIGDRTDLVHGGTMITSGTASAVVVATGAATELGRISSMLREATELQTPLTRSMARVARALTVAIGIVAGLIVIVALLRGYGVIDALLSGIALAVAAIPEGLPAIITIALAIGVQRMARRRALIRRLPAVETLGSTSVICSDKTGTLTRNEMTVKALWTPEGAFELGGVGYAPEGGLSEGGAPVAEAPRSVLALARAGALCNDASLRCEGEAWTITGDPTEGALVVAAEKLGLAREAIHRAYPREDAIPFESERKYMATLHRRPEGGALVLLKGAPEVVLRLCATLAGGAPLDAARALAEAERMASRGMRVLAVAEKPAAGSPGELREEDIDGGFALLGLEGMIDPPRPEAIEAIRACRQAGITVKMITGDHPGTARAIGEELGLVADGGVVTGSELGAMDDAGLAGAADRAHVFARVAPEHKLRLVRALQARGRVVAMTGDGVNDAPALKQADIGVAMGITGTAAAQQAADMVLADDNFATIRAAVEEGRRVYDNLVKALAFVLPTNLGEALIILVAVLFFPFVDGSPLMPILPVQILWVNLVATVTLALPLAFEAMEPNLMQRPPRGAGEPILSRFVLLRTALVAILMAAGATALFLVEYDQHSRAGEPTALAVREAQTMTVTTVVLFQIFYLMSCRSLRGSVLRIGLFSNPTVYVGIAALLALQAAFVHLPVMNALFGSAPISPAEWARAALTSAVVLPVVALEKRLRRRAGEEPPRLRPAQAR
jgi:magnesium-transporting ATPase (P-type)